MLGIKEESKFNPLKCSFGLTLKVTHLFQCLEKLVLRYKRSDTPTTTEGTSLVSVS